MEPQLLGEIRLVMADDLSGYLKVTDGKLDLVLARLNTLQETVNTMSAEVDRLKASVTQLASVDQSVITLLRGMSDQIRALKQDPAALTALADEVDARVKELGDAVTANTATTTQASTTTTGAVSAGGAPTAGGQTGGPEAGKSTRLK
jgi:chromosome segregation ATPase